MKSEYRLNDSLNLRELIETVTDHVRTNGSSESQPRTILSFLNMLLYGLPLTGGSTETWISMLQKVFSGNLSYLKAEPLARQICSGRFDNELMDNLSKITSAISGLPEEKNLYRKLQQRVSLRFFSEADKERLQSHLDQSNYAAFLLELIKHGFSRLYSIPCFFAERIYEEALTCDYDSRLRFALMREAAVSGSKNAALEYGNYLAKSGPYEKAFEYLLLAVPLKPAVWNLAFLIEKRRIGAEQAKRCRAELKIEDKLSSGKEFADGIHELDGLTCFSADPVRAEDLVFTYKVYFYLAKLGFFKAYHSMARLLLNGTVGFSGESGDVKRRALYEKYTRKAIAGNSVTAMSNEGNRLLKQRTSVGLFDPDAAEEQYMIELLSIGGEMEFMHACYNLGNYYEYALSHGQTNITRNDVKRVYEHAARLDLDGSGMSGQLFLRLGHLSEKREDQIHYFQKALSAGLSDAAYSLALCYCEISDSEQKSRFLIKAAKLLEDNLLFMTSDTKEKAASLQSVISQRLMKK